MVLLLKLRSNQLSQFTSCPTTTHWTMAKCVLRYICLCWPLCSTFAWSTLNSVIIFAWFSLWMVCVFIFCHIRKGVMIQSFLFFSFKTTPIYKACRIVRLTTTKGICIFEFVKYPISVMNLVTEVFFNFK